MIQGVHCGSVVFLDLHAVAGALPRLAERLPGIDGLGHQVALSDASWIVRIGAPRAERRALSCEVQVATTEQPHRPELRGTVHFQEVPGRPRIKVALEGACTRLFASRGVEASMEEARHAANDHARRVLEILVVELEALVPKTIPAHSAAR